MPTYTRDDGKPIVQFDGELELSPFALYRRLRSDTPLILVDGRRNSDGVRTLAGALPYPDEEWLPDDPSAEIVVFDDDGSEAFELVTSLRERGCSRVRLLFGGLDLYEFSLDPEIVGGETFLVRHRRRPL
ncbi:MAG: hypothetical protein ACE5GX_01055 [Thermoanaerobaculia bacterium]